VAVFSSPHFDDHENITFCSDGPSGLKAIVAIHNTSRGPSLGGCRMWNYETEELALIDVLRLSRGMTYKSALADLPYGGGKSVILGDPSKDKTELLLTAMGRFVDALGGRYIIAEDVGTTPKDIAVISTMTPHVAGLEGGSGDPSPATAWGVFVGMRSAIRERLCHDNFDGLRVAVQGLGNVGFELCRLLHEAGAKLWVSDLVESAIQRAVSQFAAKRVTPEAIYALDVDVFSPCALGAILNDKTIADMKALVIAGSANNQLAEERHGDALMRAGKLYAPDYLINAGGVINISYEGPDYDRETALAHVSRIEDTMSTVFHRAKIENIPTNVAADHIAEERFRRSTEV
jgi:leucine dehydrogenase